MAETSFEAHEAVELVRALTRLPDGSRVRLGPGRFAIDQPLVVSSGVELVGEPGQTVVVGNGEHMLALISEGGVTVAIRGITFENGSGTWGGAISAGVSVKLLVDQCRFTNNRAAEDGGAVFVRSAKDTRIVRCTFERNVARRGGGALDIGAGADVLVDRCVFHGNEAAVGGGVFLNGTGALELRNCTFVGNRATIHPGGAGLFVRGAASAGPSAYVSNCVFAGPDVIAADPAMKFHVYVAHCIVPAELFEQRGFTSVKPNTLGAPELVEIAPGAWGLAPGSKGVRTADAGRIEAGATDLLGKPLVRDGVADPGAFAAA
jgi:predicted outer membrane repeat protein